VRHLLIRLGTVTPGADKDTLVALMRGSWQAWGRQVAYASQFEAPHDRAWRGKAKIKARLIGKLNPDEWDLPPKPKGMRWSTYKRYEENTTTMKISWTHLHGRRTVSGTGLALQCEG
jgi:hypothetical protein